MSRKRRNKHKPSKQPNQAVPDEILAEGSGPHDDALDAVEAVEAVAAAEPELPVMDEEGTLAVAAVQPAIDEPAAEAVAAVADDGGGKKKRRGKRAAEPVAEPVEAHAGADAVELVDAAEAVDAAGEVAEAVEALGEEAEIVPIESARAEASGEGGEPALEAAAGEGEVDGELVEVEGEVGATLPTSAATMDASQLKHLVEALVFASDKPVTLLRLRQLTRVADVTRLETALAELATDFADRGLILQQVSGGYQFRTQTRYSAWVQQLIAGRPVRLSRAQLETLAIIAYRQPITRPEIDDIRGVDSSGTLKVLLDRTLVRILGKKEEVGRPMLYGTTKEFLDFFSLGDLRELPTLREYSELTPESKRVMTNKLGADPSEVPAVVEETLAEGSGGIEVEAIAAEAIEAETFGADTIGAEAMEAEAMEAVAIEAAAGEIEAAAIEAAAGEIEAAADEIETASEDLEAASEDLEVAAASVADDDELADPAVLAEAAAVARALASDHDDVDTMMAAELDASEDAALDEAPPLDPTDDLLAEPDSHDEIGD